MYFLVENDRIVGTVQEPSSFPDRQLLPAEGLDAADAYYDPDTDTVKPKGAPPAPGYYWNDDDRAWCPPIPPPDPIPSTEPDWRSLMADFLSPNHPLYESVLTKAIASGALAQWRLQNLQQVITNPELRRTDGLAFAIAQLNTALTDGEQLLTTADRQAWNALMQSHKFPENCEL